MCIRCADIAHYAEEEFDQFKKHVTNSVVDLVDGWVNPSKTNEDVELALEELCDTLEINLPRELLSRKAPKMVEHYENHILDEYKRILDKHVKQLQGNQIQPMDGTYA